MAKNRMKSSAFQKSLTEDEINLFLFQNSDEEFDDISDNDSGSDTSVDIDGDLQDNDIDSQGEVGGEN